PSAPARAGWPGAGSRPSCTPPPWPPAARPAPGPSPPPPPPRGPGPPRGGWPAWPCPPSAPGSAGSSWRRPPRPWARPFASTPPGRARSARSCSPSTTRRPSPGSGGPGSASLDAAMDPELDPLASGGLLERIVNWAGQEVGTPNGYICLIEPGSSEMVLRLGTGAYADLVGLRMHKSEGLSGRVWESGHPLAIPDYSQWNGRVPEVPTSPFRAALGVPLLSSGTVYGVIGLSFSEPGRTFTDEQVTQVSRFAEVASIALDNARLYAAAQQELIERERAERRFRTLVEELPAIVYSEEFEVGG